MVWYSQGDICSSMSSWRVMNCRQSAARLSRRSAAAELARLDMRGRPRDLGRPELQPELRGLVHGLEQQLVRVRLLLGRLLQGEQLVRAQVALVVRRARPGQNRLGEILVRLGRQGPAEHTSLQ